MQNLADHLSRALLAKLPMWSDVEIYNGHNRDDWLVLVASLPVNDEAVPGCVRLKLVQTFRFQMSFTSSCVRWIEPGPRGVPVRFGLDQERMETMMADLEKWWREVYYISCAVRDDERTTDGH